MNRQVFFTVAIEVPTHISEEQVQEGAKEIEIALAAVAAKSLHPLKVDVTMGKAHVELEDVRSFHNKFLVPMSPVPAFLDKAAHKYRLNFLQEELNEFSEAYQARDLDLAFDSLLDLAYVALGTALIMGLPWQGGWPRVQAANMTKRLAKPDGSDSKRNNPLDVIKPENFKAPSHWDLLGLTPDAVPPVFDATSAVARLVAERRDPNLPTVSLHSWVTQHQSAPADGYPWRTGPVENNALPDLPPKTDDEGPAPTCESCQ